MHIERLTLTDFRSHARFDVSVADRLVVLTGANGVGKTNVLEALSLLAPGRGLRRAAFAEMARTGGDGGFAIHALLGDGASGQTPVSIGTGIEAAHPGRRRVRVNGADTAASSLGEWLAVLWLTPAMDRLFTDTPSLRRRFLDRLVLALEPSHAHHASRYEAALKARNRLLAGPAGPDPRWLAALEDQMATHGGAVAAARHRLVATLMPRLAAVPDSDTAFPAPDLSIDSAWDDAAHGCDDARLADRLRSRFDAGRSQDRAAGRTLSGPHRDDLVVRHRVKDIAACHCSTGEQKALLLSLVLAHGEVVGALSGRPPILLLDEIAAHLDPLRRATLFERLAANGGQVWMTGTEMALFEKLGSAVHFQLDAKL